MAKKDFFIIIGGQRCGTTFLYKLLESHPQITMVKPLNPEPKIFLEPLSDIKYEKFYDTWFNTINEDIKIIGEKSTSYYENPEVARRIFDYSSDTKILFILRNPVERALSNYFFSCNNGLEKRNLEDVFLNKIPSPEITLKTSVSPFAYLERGEYSRFLIPYYQIFGKRMKVIIFEELINDENKIKEVYRFLGVDSKHRPYNWGKAVNSSERLSTAEINPEVRDLLIEHYKDEISKLENLLEKKLTYWSNKKNENTF